MNPVGVARRAIVATAIAGLLVAGASLLACFALSPDDPVTTLDATPDAPATLDATPDAPATLDATPDAPATLDASIDDFYVVPGASAGGNTFPTITLALAAAAAAPPPARIHIAAGTYTALTGESFPIEVSAGISLLGAGEGVTTIEGSGTFDEQMEPLPSIVGAALVVAGSKSGNSLSGFSLRANADATPQDGQEGIVCRGGTAVTDGGASSPNLTVRSVDVAGFEVGIRLEVDDRASGCSALVTGSKVANCEVGVLASSQSSTAVSVVVGDGTPVGGNTFDGIHALSTFQYGLFNGPAVWIHARSTGSVVGNKVTNSDIGVHVQNGNSSQALTDEPIVVAAIDANQFYTLSNAGILLEGPVVVRELMTNSFQSVTTAGSGVDWQGVGLLLDSVGTEVFPVVSMARENYFIDDDISVVLRGAGTFTPDTISDFGTSGDAGSNTFRCSSSVGDVVLDPLLLPGAATVVFPFAGNIWDHAPPSGDDLKLADASVRADTENATTSVMPACQADTGP